ncbi:glycosyl hydrolase family 28-related protein [Histidinibacterium aquaticum]|uniref:Right-handed parallel beta-helix repeat-containing protein n=1 Tax=Histidinibacterium aquaticum TaxID=2613962 RepID=A0A5J5GIW8_9RHOB|nr:glycosyl hydrolase family 28-related protein [Histidinibacterium aquaticum]KAA9008189.1 right-handed parallel beta-helix repeat-containing protein [Histidinibacterium aquaticum]
MNKAITDGVIFDPPPFSDGLDVWASGDGTPGSPTYAGAAPGSFVPADQNFDGCLEVVKVETVQSVRHMGETPILPGCYLRISTRVKCTGGPLPAVRIAGWAGRADGTPLSGATQTGPSVQLTAYGEVVEVSAIVGTGDRGGVDMVWSGAAYGHFGLDITGPNSALVRIDDFTIEDVTSIYLRDILAFVDVRDYGATGDGTTDDSAAFEAADAAAGGRTVNVPEGTYYLGGNVTMDNPVTFEGTLVQPQQYSFVMQRNFDYDSYLRAFGNEEEALKKAVRALFSPNDHESLDLCGRRIAIFAPLDVSAAAGTETFAQRRVIRHGQIVAASTGDWEDEVASSEASYAPANPKVLTDVVNVGAITRGMRVTGPGVGREVFVVSRNLAGRTVTLSRPLHGGAGTRTYGFRRYRYMLDFSGFDALSVFGMEDIEFQCQGLASAVMLPRDGTGNQIRDCFFTKPKDRGVTSIGTGCQGLQVDDCQFLSAESSELVQNRSSIALNTNNNDVKLRGNRCVHFRHFAVLGGQGSMVVGNHFFHGDSAPQGVRRAGIVIANTNCQTTLSGNYIDNGFIEWTNEHDATPDLGAEFSYGALTLTGNTFLVSDAKTSFSFLVVKPHGTGHFIQGLAVVGNVFKSVKGNIDSIEAVDDSFAGLNLSRLRNIEIRANTFNGINSPTFNPASVKHTQNTPARNWTISPGGKLPFGGRPRFIESVVPERRILQGSATHFGHFYTLPDDDPAQRTFRVVWSEQVTGTVRAMVRADNPA